MKLLSPQKEIYAKERLSAIEAQRLAQEIAFGPIVFQVSRLMVKFGIFQMLDDNKNGLTMSEIIEKTKLSKYAIKILLESSLTIGTVLLKEEKFYLSKAGWFLIHDDMVRVNINFNHDVNYLGLFNLEESLLNERPEGLKVFGNWSTIYEGLSQLPEQVKKSWFDFDHFYSDNSFEQALEIVFANNPANLLDVGGNTGRWATKCVGYSNTVNVTIMDLPQQLEMMKEQTKHLPGVSRINGYAANILEESTAFPKNFDAIWMSQFLDCFSENEIISILKRASASMSRNSRLYIMETFWDRQRFETASYCLAQISIYFTAMANGNSKMYHSDDMEMCVNSSGLVVEKIHDGLGLGHSIMQCRINK
ncbi:class I SAM-dependent methyltransferase [Bacteroidales bacterium OttesenSCG-928-I21]|nr:class I SAM-dependent methyltransferase [Bacteroidales bacterium OttesenSCG-928-I21]